ncbi:calcium-related spray protein [Xylariaceae sp. FL0804]|nr:calcium-related spray protein [Xylariaceae sp. FL0804]
MMASFLRAPLLLALSLVTLVLPAAADNILRTNSLNTCQANSDFTASLFDVVYSADSGVAAVNISATSTIEANVHFDVEITIYGYSFLRRTIDPCTENLPGFCPMVAGKLSTPFNIDVSKSATSGIPSIAYNFPDLDAKVKVFINATSGPDNGTSLACIEADVSNGKTVNLLGVKWASAIVAGLALASSAIISGLGHVNAASHVAATALSLTSYFQAQAMVGLVGIPLPPAVQAWTQDFQWSMGIINVGFMQTIFTWYQRSTGGTAATILDTLTQVSVEVQKRSMPLTESNGGLSRRAAMLSSGLVEQASHLTKRGNIRNSGGSYVVYGIQRVAFKAGIETTNLFLTGLVFFYIFMVLSALAVAAFKGFCELAAKQKWIKGDAFQDFRHDWVTVLKGVLFRITLIGHPPVTILCLWEFTQDDSAAEMVLAVFFLLYVNIALAFAAYKVIRIAHRSVKLHRNPAYILFSDSRILNKWGFLYIQFRASAYYFIVPLLCYTFVKALFIAFAQNAGTVQAIALLLIEAAALIAAVVMRPWMDKKTSSFNIAICVVNFLNAIFLLIFTDVFDQPGLVTGIVGVVLWILNAATTLVLLVLLIVSTLIVFFTDNPDGRYKFMADDRTSFMKSHSQLATTTELDALAQTARGEKYGSSGYDMDDLEDSLPSHSRPTSLNRPLATSAANSIRGQPLSPHADPSAPFLPGHSHSPLSRTSTPSDRSVPARSQHTASPSPWQRGAGFDQSS